MDTREAYNIWASQYDTNENKTRDLEAKSIREVLAPLQFDHCLEIGCGTGKNTEWLIQKAVEVISVDLSEEMLSRARQKIQTPKVRFIQADITQPWNFGKSFFDLISFSLVLEHIEDLDVVFQEVSSALKKGGHVYIGELHPFKQYSGSKARFETEEGLQIVNCYDHHISDFINAAKRNNLQLVQLAEYFDEHDRRIPRILSLLFIKH